MELSVFKLDGTQSGDLVPLKEDVFGVKGNDNLIHHAVLSYLAARRQGTHLARNRALVSGSGRKPHRQKGTGRARAGTIKSNIWRGGGKSFGPKPHGYAVGMNKKEKKLARRTALSNKARTGAIILVEDFAMEKPETKYIVGILKAFNITNNGRTMLVIREHSPDIWRSCRNIKNLSLSPAAQLSTYDIVRQERLLIQKGALEHINQVF